MADKRKSAALINSSSDSDSDVSDSEFQVNFEKYQTNKQTYKTGLKLHPTISSTWPRNRKMLPQSQPASRQQEGISVENSPHHHVTAILIYRYLRDIIPISNNFQVQIVLLQ